MIDFEIVDCLATPDLYNIILCVLLQKSDFINALGQEILQPYVPIVSAENMFFLLRRRSANDF